MRKLIVKSSLLIVNCLILLTITNYLLPIAQAAESSPSADVKTKLEELKKDIASKAARLKEGIITKLTNKAYVGNVKTKTVTSLTLATKTGAKIVSVNQDTEFKSNIKARKNLSLKTLLEEDYVAALGDVDEAGVLTAKKIVLLNPIPSTLNPKTYLWGQIVSISDQLATLKNRDSKNIAVTLPTTLKIKGLDFVILTGLIGKNDIFEAEFIYVIPQGGILKLKKIATPSAQMATSSAKPKPSTR